MVFTSLPSIPTPSRSAVRACRKSTRLRQLFRSDLPCYALPAITNKRKRKLSGTTCVQVEPGPKKVKVPPARAKKVPGKSTSTRKRKLSGSGCVQDEPGPKKVKAPPAQTCKVPGKESCALSNQQRLRASLVVPVQTAFCCVPTAQ